MKAAPWMRHMMMNHGMPTTRAIHHPDQDEKIRRAEARRVKIVNKRIVKIGITNPTGPLVRNAKPNERKNPHRRYKESFFSFHQYRNRARVMKKLSAMSVTAM